jgi:hypothetical protein
MKKISFIFIIYVLFQACFLAFCYQSISEVELRNDFTDNTWYESDSNIVRNNTLSSYHLDGSPLTNYIWNFSFREDDRSAYTPNYGFEIYHAADDYYRHHSITASNIGEAYMFFYVDAEFINNKYIEVKWGGYSSYPSSKKLWFCSLWDGKADRGAYQNTSKYRHLHTELQAIQTKTSRSTWSDTFDVQINSTSAENDTCTIVFYTSDGWTGSTVHGYVYEIRINNSSGGSNNIWSVDFNANDHSIVYEQSGTDYDYGYIDNVTEYVLGGYESDGVLYFDNVLSGVNNTALWYVSNTTLNSQELNVEFSNDNITWDKSTSLVDGLNVIFLESLNYSDLYMRHNFTNVASSTPYLNNVSIFYEGSDTGAINDRHEWFLPLILFSGIIFIIVYGVKRN